MVAPTHEGHLPQATGVVPTTARRVWAVVALAAGAFVVVAVAVFLLSNPWYLLVGVIGVAAAGAGAWWLATERMPRRAIGAAVLAAGLVVVVGALVAAALDAGQALIRLVVVVVLLAVATWSARAALVVDLHELDAQRLLTRARPRRPVLICNLRSGSGKVESFGLTELAEEMGVEAVVLQPGDDLAQLARDAIARGADCLGMAGGDGSQALVAGIATEHGVPFVCISAGTRNHFALDLGLDRDDPRTGMEAFREGVERYVDYGTVGGRVFVNNVSLGVYATIVQQDGYRDAKTETSLTMLPQLLGPDAEPYDLQFTTPTGQDVDGAFLVLVSNNPYTVGRTQELVMRRGLDDGQLGVLAVSAKSGREAAALVARSVAGLGGRDPNLLQFTATRFEIRSRSGTALAGIDGESLELATPLEFRIHPRGLRVLVPQDSIVTAQARRARGFDLGDLLTVAAGRPVTKPLPRPPAPPAPGSTPR